MADRWSLTPRMVLFSATVLAVAAVAILLVSAAAPRPEPAHTHPEIATLTPRVETLEKNVNNLQQSAATKGELAAEVGALQGQIGAKANAAEVQHLQQRVGTIDATVAEHGRTISQKADTSDLNALGQLVAQDRTSITALRTDLADTNERVDENKTGISSLLRDFADNKTMVKNHAAILDAISQKQGSNYYPKILGNMNQDDFRDEMRDAVQRAIDTKSTLYVTNNTSTVQAITINETEKDVLNPGETTPPIVVPTGNVSTRLSGERSTNWMVGPPSYELRLEIVLRAGVVTYSPF